LFGQWHWVGVPSHGIPAELPVLAEGRRDLRSVRGDDASSWEVHVCHVPEEMDTIRLHTRA
jgi:hypothetical protein